MLCLYGRHKTKKIEDTNDFIKVILEGFNVAFFTFQDKYVVFTKARQMYNVIQKTYNEQYHPPMRNKKN